MSTYLTHHTCFGRTALALLLALMTTTTAWADDLYEGKWYYRNLNDHAVITGIKVLTFTAADTARYTSIIIPDSLGGLPVTGFEDFTFEGFTNLKSIEFPANSQITTIPTDFARGLSSLNRVDIEGNTSDNYSLPASITTIGAGAFAGTNITELNMPNVAAIGGSSTEANSAGAFEGCNSLRRVTIDQDATIADDAFANTDYTGSGNSFITYNGPLANWNYRAYRRSPKVVVFCNDGSCGWAGDTGTQNCVYWTKDSEYNVLFACDDADAYSQHPDKQAKLNENWNMKRDGTSDLTITSLTMRNVYTTGEWSSSIETVDLQKGVTTIDEGAFQGITALTSVSMTADVSSIEAGAFYGCTSLKDLYFWGTVGQWGKVSKFGIEPWDKDFPADFQVHWRCTATFNMQGHGTAPEAQTVWNGNTVTQPTTDPQAQGYHFDGWYKDAACTQAFDFSAALDDNVTVYAKWTALPNTISFDLDGKGTAIDAQTVYSGDRVTEPALQFTETEGIEGWYTDAARQQRYDFSTPVDQGMTLYAKWATAGTATFSVTGGEHGTVTLTDAAGHKVNASGMFIRGLCTLTVAPNDGYTYTGSHALLTNDGASTGPTPISGSSTRSYTLDLSNYNVAISIDFGQQPVVSIIATTDGTATAGSYTLTDQQKPPINYSEGGVLQHVCDPNNPSFPLSYYLTLSVTTNDPNTSCAVTIVNNGKKTVYNDYTEERDFAPYGSIAIELFFYNKTTGVVTLLDDDSNATLISDANDKKRMVTLSRRTLKKDGNWNTLCLPFDVELAGSPLADATLMELDTEGTYDGHQTGFDDGTLRLYFKETASIKAGMPYLIKWTKPNKYDNKPSNYDITSPVFAGVTIRSAAPKAVTSADGKVTFTGAYSPVAITAEDRSILYLGAASTLYYPEAEMTIGSFRAHFELNGIMASPLSQGGDGVRGIVLGFGEGTATSVTTPFSNRRGVGGEAAWFSLDGRRLSGKPSQPGVYIHNGRKMVVK